MITITLSIFLLLAVGFVFTEKERGAANAELLCAQQTKSVDIEGMAYAVFTIVAVLIIGFRTPGVDADSQQYLASYYMLGAGNTDLMEPSFFLICYIANVFNESQVAFLLYALLAIPLKAFSIFRLSHFKILSLMVWISHFFLLQDMTQIRVAVATALFLYALYYLIKGERKHYVVLCLLAVFFHYSALILLPLVVLGTKKMNTLWRVTLFILPLCFYALYFKGLNFIDLLPLGAFQDKLDMYENLRDKGITGDEINIFNMLSMFRLLVYYLLLIMYNVVYERCHEITLYLKIYCISICCYVGLSFLPALAIRGSEVFAVIDVLAIPCIVYLVKPSWLMKAAVVVFAIGLFVMNIIFSRYVREFV
jgi:hypothetical protein